MKILIADDEAPARERLRRLVREITTHHDVAGEASNGEDVLSFCRNSEVDVVLLDVRMPGMDGLETAAQLAELNPPPAVILVTAYEEHALDAFASRVADYLVKPVRRERLEAALQRVRVPTRAQRDAIRDDNTDGRRQNLTARYRGGLRTVPIDEVIYLQADHKYVRVGYPDGELLVEQSLRSLAEEFPDLFLRIHRNALVARRALEGIRRREDGSHLVQLRGSREELAVSRRHLVEVKRILRGER